MDIEEQMELSAAIGMPLVDLLGKAEAFVAKVHQLLREETPSARLGVLLMGVAFLYHVELAAPSPDILKEANRALLVSLMLFSKIIEEESDQ